jgi:hypothetical protein
MHTGCTGCTGHTAPTRNTKHAGVWAGTGRCCTCIKKIDTIILHIHTNDAYYYDTHIHDTGAAALPPGLLQGMYHNNRHNYTHLYWLYTLTTPIWSHIQELFAPRCTLCAYPLEGYFLKHPYFESETYCMSHEDRTACFRYILYTVLIHYILYTILIHYTLYTLYTDTLITKLYIISTYPHIHISTYPHIQISTYPHALLQLRAQGAPPLSA